MTELSVCLMLVCLKLVKFWTSNLEYAYVFVLFLDEQDPSSEVQRHGGQAAPAATSGKKAQSCAKHA